MSFQIMGTKHLVAPDPPVTIGHLDAQLEWPHDAPIFHALVYKHGYPFGHDWFMAMPHGKTADGRDGEKLRQRAHENARGPLGPERPPQPSIDTGLPDDELPHGWVVGEW